MEDLWSQGKFYMCLTAFKIVTKTLKDTETSTVRVDLCVCEDL